MMMLFMFIKSFYIALSRISCMRLRVRLVVGAATAAARKNTQAKSEKSFCQ